MFVAFNNINFVFAPKAKKQKDYGNLYNSCLHRCTESWLAGVLVIKFSGAQLSRSRVVRNCASRLLMGLPGIKISILA